MIMFELNDGLHWLPVGNLSCITHNLWADFKLGSWWGVKIATFSIYRQVPNKLRMEKFVGEGDGEEFFKICLLGPNLGW